MAPCAILANAANFVSHRWSEVPNSDQLEEVLKGRTPAAPRLGEVNDIAPIVAFLCQEESRWVTASVLNSNGGLLPV